MFALLLLATAAGWSIRRLRPALTLRDYFRRLQSWWIVTAVMLVIVATAPLPGSLLFDLLIAAALYECCRALWPIDRLLLGAALPWIVLSLAPLHLLLLDGGASVVLFCWLILLTQFNDIAQYFAGKAFGRHRIVPRISPNKTVEGLIGGVLFSMVVSLLFTPRLLPLDRIQALVFGLLTGLGGFAGDIAFSWLKRRAGIKDFGTLLPGQGGVLDRLDSVTFTAPLLSVYMLSLTS